MTPTWSAALALDARAEAGESPWWSAAENCLYWVVAQPPLPRGGRLNDATVDARGRLVIGAMTAPDDTDARAALYRIDLDGRCASLLAGFRTVNGLAFAPDGTWLHVSE